MGQHDIQPAQFDLVAVFDRYHSEIYAFLFFRLNQNQHTAEDLTQEVFLKAWKNRDAFDERKAGIRHWLYIIARRILIDHFRTTKPTESYDAIGEQAVQPEEFENMENAAMITYIRDKMKALPADDQELLTLRYINELEIDEVAAITDRNYEATKMALHRALKKLRQLV